MFWLVYAFLFYIAILIALIIAFIFPQRVLSGVLTFIVIMVTFSILLGMYILSKLLWFLILF